MATVVTGPPAFSGDLVLFHTTDPLLGNSPVLVLHGPAASIGATSSRIQVHIFTPAGLGSYSRLSVSPTSPFYSAVSNLPREEQGDEVCRGLAFGLKKYFTELPAGVKQEWSGLVKTAMPDALFGDDHIAILATRMARIENIDDVIADIFDAFCAQRLSWLDVDLILPPGTIKQRPHSSDGAELDDHQSLKEQYGRYADLVARFGDVTFLPTSRLKRAPSRATSIGRSASFTNHQRENVSQQIDELVTTEESYVGRLEELQKLFGSLGANATATFDKELGEVFSTAVNHISEANSKFLDSLRAISKNAKAIAQEDVDRSQDLYGGTEPALDSQGLLAIARCLCEWFPQFAAGYKVYLSRHAQASQTLRNTLKNVESLPDELQDLGEQKLSSLLIEPVQRLPRYNLYIDNISRQLPTRHPALKLLLKARDMITEICAENEGSEIVTVVERLQSRTRGWPPDTRVTGRLISAADFVELLPPYGLEGCDGLRGILLLFSDGVIVIEKSEGCKTTARTLLTELENSLPSARSVESSASASGDLHFVQQLRLEALLCTECHDGYAMQLLTFCEHGTGVLTAQEAAVDSCQILKFENTYEGKASRLIEELAKARIEDRFSEAERESSKWEVRATESASDCLGLFSAIFENTNRELASARHSYAPIRIVVEADKHSEQHVVGQDGVRTVVHLASRHDGHWQLAFNSLDGELVREHVGLTELVPTICRKLAMLTTYRLSIQRSSMTACMLGRNIDILHSIDLQSEPEEHAPGTPTTVASREREHRSRSPKKLLSSLLSSVGPGDQPHHLLKKESRDLPTLPAQGSISRTPSAPPKPPSRESRPSSRDQTCISFSSVSSDQFSSSSKMLEDTLSAYVLALQARKGNIVGKNLKMRVVADELLVNELYNSLLEDPNMMVLAAQAPLDVLFAAFEKFLNVAWKENVGQVMPPVVLQDIQSKAETLFPRDFDDYFKSAMGRLASPNQRAFKSILKLLADLLDGTGNDSDRGILTACFAELLVTEGNPHDYIALIDRFVDDTDTYFGEPVEESKHASGLSGSHKRSRSVNSSSITSNTSSLRRKFGFGTLSRENSKSEQESKVASVWRTLSKTNRNESSAHSSPSKVSSGQPQSIDDGHHLNARPGSREGPKASGFGESLSAPGIGQAPSSHNLGLATIGEHPSFIPTGPPKKKRRSSLSDLQSIDGSPRREVLVSPSPRRPLLAHSKTEEKELPQSPPSTPSSKSNSARFGTPQASSRSRLPPSFRQEPSPAPPRSFGNDDQPRPKSSGNHGDEVVITLRPTSNIPSLVPRLSSAQKQVSITPARTGLSERPGAGNIVKKPSPRPDKSTATSSTAESVALVTPHRRLRMQSPQKLRERLQNEQRSAAAIQNELQDEISKIGEELTLTPSHRSPTRGTKTIATRGSVSQPGNMDLAQRVLKLEGQLPRQVEELTSHIDKIQADLTSSLSVSETKCKKLDQLYREANAENDALYARFNEELGKIMKSVRGGEGVEEMKKKLKESQEEAAKLRRETSRLKRENLGLRAQLKE